MEPIYIGLAAFIGGLISAVLGFLDSQEAFNIRKFIKSCLSALLAALAFAAYYQYNGEPVGLLDIFQAILVGAGVEAGINRAIGAFKALKKGDQ